MQTVIYDGSFEGLFTAVFEIYEYKINEPDICKEGLANISMFDNVHIAHSNKEKAARVIMKLQQKISLRAFNNLYKTFLSDLTSIENIMLRYIQFALKANLTIETDYSNADVLTIQQVSKKVDREKHRMKAFVRFQLTKDELYYAIVQPDYNVLPLISYHFEQRYADQRWLIYDVRRKYGLYYDLENVSEVNISFNQELNNKATLKSIHDEKEDLYQTLWQTYFDNVNIKARKNMKLHIQHMPKRYWKFLTEKQK